MAKNRQERYPTAVAFATALARVAQKLDPGAPLAAELAQALPLQEETVVGRRLALIISNDHYDDPVLSQLIRPAADAPELARLLQDPEIGRFDEVILLVNEPTYVIRRAIARFFADKNGDDSLLLYVSGHAVLDGRNQLYLTGKNTEHDLLRGTAIPAVFIADEMDNSEAKQQILILDCHHSHASLKDLPSRVGKAVDTGSSFARYGRERIILTANDTTHYIWGEDGIIGYAENSRFTNYLIRGLTTGAADANNDGKITIEELFDYVCDQLAGQEVEIQQVPRKWAYNEQSEIVMAQNSHLPFSGPVAQVALAEAADKPATAKGPESLWAQPAITTRPAKAFIPLMALAVVLLFALFIASFLPAAGTAQTQLLNTSAKTPVTITMVATETVAERALTTPVLSSATIAFAATATPTPPAIQPPATQASTTTTTDVAAHSYLAEVRLPSTIFTKPTTSSDELTFVDTGDQVVVLGRSMNGHWLYVRSADSIEGYIYSPRLEWGGDFASLPAVAPRILATATTMPASCVTCNN
jgi:hypothetical protein